MNTKRPKQLGLFCLLNLVNHQKGILLSFSLNEKETKNQGKKMLPRASRLLSGLGWPAFLPVQRTSLLE